METMDWSQRHKEEAKNIAIAMGDAFNNTMFDSETFVAQIRKEHNTIQQTIMKNLFNLMIEMAKDNWGTDGRNEAAQQACKVMINAYKDKYGFEPKHLPVI